MYDRFAAETDLDALGLDQRQKERVIEALLLVTYADGVIDRDETRFVDRVIGDSAWESERDLAAFVAEARGRVRKEAEDPARRRRFLARLAEGIASREARRAVYLLCDAVANADERVVGSEAAVLEDLLAAFRS